MKKTKRLNLWKIKWNRISQNLKQILQNLKWNLDLKDKMRMMIIFQIEDLALRQICQMNLLGQSNKNQRKWMI